MSEDVGRKAFKFDVIMEIFNELPDNTIARQILEALERLDADYQQITIECDKNNLTYSVNSEYICVVVNGQSYRRATSVDELMGLASGSLKSAIQKKRMEKLNDKN